MNRKGILGLALRAAIIGTGLVGAQRAGGPGQAVAGAMSANNFGIPSKDVALYCAPLRYRINCSISLRANPEYSSYCFYISGMQSYPMKTDYRFGFTNEIISVHVNNGLRITAQLTELRTGRRARCSE